MTIENTLPVNNAAPITGKLVLVLLFLAVATPMLAAYWIFFTGQGIPSNTINKGTLLSPATTVLSLPIHTSQHHDNQTHNNHPQASTWANQKHWQILTVAEIPCAEVCLQQLYTARQVHIRLAKEAHRIERYLVLIQQQPNFHQIPNQAIEDSGLSVVSVTPSAWQQQFSGASLTPNEHIVVVDQDGFAMMTYDANNSGSDLLDDLTRLLKFSYE